MRMSRTTGSFTLIIMLPDAICHQFTNNVFILAFIFVGDLGIP